MKRRVNERDYELKIVKGARDGDSEAFKELFLLYRDKILNFINYQINDNIDTAKDLLQETFISAFKGISNLKDIEKAGSWLYSIAHNKCRDYFRSSKNNIIYNSELVDYMDTVETHNLNNKNNFNIDAHIIESIINSIPEKYREVFIMRKYNNMKYEEITGILNCSEKTVNNRMRKAIDIFRNKVKKAGLMV